MNAFFGKIIGFIFNQVKSRRKMGVGNSHYPINSRFDVLKAKAMLLYVLNNLEDKSGEFHKVLKIIYFADQQHLTKFGRQIVNDNYFKMDKGPVASALYGAFNAVKGKDPKRDGFETLYESFQVKHNCVVFALEQPDMDELSPSDIECLDDSIKKYGKSSFSKRKIDSHDRAWEKAPMHKKIDKYEIAKAADVSEEMLNYIKNNDEIFIRNK